ncbi:alcohol oxidase [Bimuria novae-zelandiae CBS 107.79]|uniref:Alcohol oxidase n=1 Tax=Bimuria novae-zelandiae CBS 107.79 TaxID=1447943 RepID=A0A6A5V8L5_9PLEO|nr:alcohol oxidase [Bimuria novae-zelandiae CBS 107.79]
MRLAIVSAAVLAAATLSIAHDTFDYIVIGSGPGGGPLASNLARANYSVLLLEAGDQSPNGNDMVYPPTVAWDFFVKHYADEKRNMMNNHLVWKTKEGRYAPAGSAFLGVHYPRGATVGGSSMINAKCTWLPPNSDWNYIQNLTGDASWNADNMRSIFQRIEKNNYLPNGTAGHGFDGYFQTNMNKPTSVTQPVLGIAQAIAQNFSYSTAEADVAARMGSDPNYLDPQRDWTTGIWGLPTHTNPNFDRYSSRDYIQDTIQKKFPLTLSINSLATRVLFDRNGTSCGGVPRATGVEYLQGKSIYKADARYSSSNNGTLKTATARKEVIVSSGTFNTPQLLMLSGIGPKEQLAQFNIPLVVDAQGVGRNLMDNQEMPIVAQFEGQAVGFSQPFVMMKTKRSPDGERDMFLMQGTFVFRGFWPANQTNTALPQDPPNIYGMMMVKAKPQNHKGYVKLTSSDPTDPPEINFMLYEEGKETDMGAMKETIAWARKMYAGAKGINFTAIEPPCPEGPDAQGYCGKADEDWIIGQTFGHHPTSTAAIGKEGDPMAVLDGKFRVRGVKGLRVVDASAFPKTPGIFPVVSTFMISEKASDAVKEDAKKDVCAA